MPEGDWDALVLRGLGAVWLMGVWERSEIGRRIALEDEGVVAAMRAALPDLTASDVVGSAYCVREYRVDPRLGGNDGLLAARRALARRDLRLVVDFVPNHVAQDHPWVASRPDYFVPGERTDPPGEWVETRGGTYATARDPYFPPWRDVVQLDPMSPGYRDAAVATLTRIAELADGVRCDMAMLLLDDVAERTWPGRLQPRRPEPFWVEVTRRVRAVRPDFVFLAEAYWDLEATLLEQGFDLVYDKRLYDRLRHDDAHAIRAHLVADLPFQERLVRFLENHDEPRAASAFPPDRLRAAAVVLATLPGTILLYEGQLEGRRVRPPVQLARRPHEEPDEGLVTFWHELLAQRIRLGRWRLLEVEGSQTILAWRWDGHAVAVNWADARAEARLRELDLYVRLDSYGWAIVPLESANASARP